MIKTNALAMTVLMGLAPSFAIAQGFDPFDVGGGLLQAPAPAASGLQAGTGAATDGGAAAGGAPGSMQTDRADEGTGPLLTARVSLGYTYEDLEDEPDNTYLSGLFDLGVFTETRNQTFRFNVGAEARLEEAQSDLVNPFARLDYTLGNRSTLLAFDLDWREADVGDSFLPGDFDSDDLIIDGGTREVHSARVTLTTGRDRRFGTRTSLGFRQLAFTDTVDPELVDEDTIDASTELRFSLSRRAELTAFADYVETSESDAVDTVETDIRYGFGIDVLIDRAWTGTAELAWTDEEVETTAGVTDENGFELDLSLTRDLTNGDLAVLLSLDTDEDDTITTASLRRQLALANGAQLSGELGVVSFDGGDTLPLFGFTYSQEILRGSVVTAALNQNGGLTDDDEGVLRTTFNASWAQELTRNSSLSINGALASVNPQEGTEPDTRAVSFGVAYNHDLTEDWSLVARAQTRINFEDDTQTDQENTFSINLERTFSFRP